MAGRRRSLPCDIRSSLDHLVGKLLELRWNIKSKCGGGLEVDHQIEPLRPLYRQVTWLGTTQDLPDVFPASSKHLTYVRPISYQTARFWEFPKQADEWESFGYRNLADFLRRLEH